MSQSLNKKYSIQKITELLIEPFDYHSVTTKQLFTNTLAITTAELLNNNFISKSDLYS